MAKKCHAHSIGLAFGGSLGLFHLVWSLMVLFKIAQPAMNFIFDLHRIVPPYTIAPFDWIKMVELVAMTAVIGYVCGFVFALFLKVCHK